MSELQFIKNDSNNISVKNRNGTPILSDNNDLFKLSFYKTDSDFMDAQYMGKYINKIEKLVRTNSRYNKYIHYLKTEIGLDCCSIMSNVNSTDASVEMHHGPIFTLFDIVFIVLNYNLRKGNDINTFKIADEVLSLHEKNMVQVVMLTSTAHQMVHDGEIFININQAWGDIMKFLKKYKRGLLEEHKYKSMEYMKLSQKYDSNTKDILEINKKVSKWVNRNIN